MREIASHDQYVLANAPDEIDREENDDFRELLSALLMREIAFYDQYVLADAFDEAAFWG